MITTDLGKNRSKEIPRAQQHTSLHITAEYFSDPLCCWSWAFEPQWRRLRYEFAPVLSWKNRMGGLISDWKNYSDTLLDVDRPIQMGPIWREAAGISGMPLDERVWAECVPSSSFPACFAVKTAEIQGQSAGDIYLRKTREAIMLQKRDISKSAVLMEIARETAISHPDLFSFDLFREHFFAKEAIAELQNDMDQTRLKGIQRFPTLLLRDQHGRGAVITGYRPYDAIIRTLLNYFPDLPEPTEKYPDRGGYKRKWPDAQARELEEIKVTVHPFFKEIKNSRS